MQYIYTRVSREDLTTANQLHPLQRIYPAAIAIEETASGYYDKPALNQLITQLQKGDTLIVYALDRLGRSTIPALRLLEDLKARGIGFISYREGIDLTTPIGKFIATILLSVAEMERNLIVERTKRGMATRKATIPGWTCGRKPRVNAQRVVALRAAGYATKEIAGMEDTTRANVLRILAKYKKEATKAAAPKAPGA